MGPSKHVKSGHILMAFCWRADSDPKLDAGWLGLEMSPPKMFIPQISTVPQCLLTEDKRCQNVYIPICHILPLNCKR